MRSGARHGFDLEYKLMRGTMDEWKARWIRGKKLTAVTIGLGIVTALQVLFIILRCLVKGFPFITPVGLLFLAILGIWVIVFTIAKKEMIVRQNNYASNRIRSLFRIHAASYEDTSGYYRNNLIVLAFFYIGLTIGGIISLIIFIKANADYYTTLFWGEYGLFIFLSVALWLGGMVSEIRKRKIALSVYCIANGFLLPGHPPMPHLPCNQVNLICIGGMHI